MSHIDITLGKDSSSNNHIKRLSRSQFLRLSEWFTLVLCLLAAVLPLPFGQPGVWSTLELSGLCTWQTALGGILGIIVSATVAALIVHFQPLQVIVRHLSRLAAWETFRTFDYVLIALMAALGEELLFRGALQPLIGLVPTAVIFGLLHATSVAHVTLAGLLGLLLGSLFQWTGNLWSPIAMHMTVDLIAGLLLAHKLRPRVLSAQGD